MTWLPPVLLSLLAVGQVDTSTQAPEIPSQNSNVDTEVLPSLGGTRRLKTFPEVWGYAGANVYYAGSRMAPNGRCYGPLSDLNLDLNIGLLPEKKLYIFTDSMFWLQAATAGQTQNNWDFTKREFDFNLGLAWNYWSQMELRLFGYAFNNLNRGNSTINPSGYNDGWGLENRYYFLKDDMYDVPRLSFLSFGYLPSKCITGGDGITFSPGFFARAYLSYDLGFLHSYTYFDGQMLCEDGFHPRLLSLDAGVAARPFECMEGLEFRMGIIDVGDVGASTNRALGYFGFRFVF